MSTDDFDLRPLERHLRAAQEALRPVCAEILKAMQACPSDMAFQELAMLDLLTLASDLAKHLEKELKYFGPEEGVRQ